MRQTVMHENTILSLDRMFEGSCLDLCRYFFAQQPLAHDLSGACVSKTSKQLPFFTGGHCDA